VPTTPSLRGRDAIQNLRASTTATNELAHAIAALGEELGGAGGNRNSARLRVSVEGKPQKLQPVEIKVDAYGRSWKGHVTSLGGAAGSVLSAIPCNSASNPQHRQRVPVRIDFDRSQDQDLNPAGLLKPGLSVVPAVSVRWLRRTPSSSDDTPGGRL
jgi:hypothetical protein